MPGFTGNGTRAHLAACASRDETNRHFSRWTWVKWYQNVTSLDFIVAEYDGGGVDNWSYKTCKAPVSLFTGQMPFLSSNQYSVRALKEVLLLLLLLLMA